MANSASERAGSSRNNNNNNNCTDSNRPNREGEGVPDENETVFTDILGLQSVIAKFLKPKSLGTKFVVELKENEEGERSIQIRKKEKRTKLTDSRRRNNAPLLSQKVASTDHLLERILDYLDVSSLLQCRIVSHRFKAFAGVLLRNRIQLKFVDLLLHDHESGKLLSELSMLLRNKLIVDLPCNNIQFIEDIEYLNWKDEALQDFFDVFGSRIEKLSFLSRIKTPSLDSLLRLYKNKHVQDDWVEGIEKLLLEQTPSLKNLDIQIQFPCNVAPQRCYSAETGLYFIRTDEGFRQVEEKCKTILHKHRHLSVLRMGGTYDGVPLKLLETIIQLSPNLQEVLIDHHNYMPFVQPMNRLHLLKTAEIKFIDYYGVSAVKKVLDFVEDRDLSLNPRLFQLRHLTLRLDGRDSELGANNTVGFISAINRLLTYTGESLESFSWTVDGTVNLQEIEFPNAMPNVQKVVLKSVRNTPETPGPIFPRGFYFPGMFPNLRELVLVVSGPHGEMGAFTEELDFESQFEGDVPMIFVKRVRIEHPGREWHPQVSPESVARFKGWFPNADVTYDVTSGDDQVPQQDQPHVE